jgi:RNA polymerase sigma-70 factor (ECF subfamily)
VTPATRPTDERTLVESVVARGDERAFRALYRRHTPALYQLALRLTAGAEADAEELLQESWVRALQAMTRFAWRSSLRTWLCGILINCAREWSRANSRSFEGREADAAAEDDDPAGRVDLERAIALLPTGYRHVLVLHDVEGYTHEEIASLLQIDAGTSKSQLARARRRVRAWLGHEPWTKG